MKSSPRIGYVPINSSLSAPGDRRRFVAYARARGLAFELARPDERYDIVVLTELADISVWAKASHGKIIYDLIDSYLAIPRNDIKQRLRGPFRYLTGAHKHLLFDYWSALAAMCRRADAVICSTIEQKAQISEFCPNVHIVLDVHTATVRRVKSDYRCRDVFRIAWEGLASNVPQLREIADVVRDLAQRHPIEIQLVTDPVMRRYLGHVGSIPTLEVAQKIFKRVVVNPWEEATCADLICGSDAAIIPIDLSDPFVRGKPENKLLLLWRMGMPVATSATPAYQRAMAGAGVNLVCSDADQWHKTLEALIEKEDMRREAGQRGKEYVERNHGEATIYSQWDAVFASVGYPSGEGARP